MLIEFGKRIDECSEDFNKELENIKNIQPELKKNNNWKLKANKKDIKAGDIEGDMEEHINDLRGWIVEIIQSELWKEKQIWKNKDSLGTSETAQGHKIKRHLFLGRKAITNLA